jgi:hypothetical protein
MVSPISVQSFVEALLEGLKRRSIGFAVSHGTLDCQLFEVFIEEANELILVPEGVLSQDLVRWTLEIRTPIKIRLTIFTNEVTEYKLRVMRAVTNLKEDGVVIPNVENAISIQELSNRNLVRLLESLENWHDLKTSGRPLPRHNCSIAAPAQIESSVNAPSEWVAPLCLKGGDRTHSELSLETQTNLHMQLRDSIKTYWTERYLAKFLNLPAEKAQEIARRIGIGREVCGQEVLYFFDRSKALRTYFVHLVKATLEELDFRYEEGPNQAFILPQFNLALVFFDGEKERIQILAENYARSYDLMFVVPEQLRITVGRIPDDFFRVIPLTRTHIAGALRGLVHENPTHRSPAIDTLK